VRIICQKNVDRGKGVDRPAKIGENERQETFKCVVEDEERMEKRILCMLLLSEREKCSSMV